MKALRKKGKSFGLADKNGVTRWATRLYHPHLKLR
jgi:hypothetical protein